MTRIPIDKVFPNPDQSRKDFDRGKLEELAQSIREHDLMEPIVVVKRKGGYMIVAGERRYRACQMAGLKNVLVRVIRAGRKKVAELALIENLQRDDLNLIEEARAYQGIMNMDYSMEQLAEKLGFKQPWRVQERLNLLKLDPLYQDLLIKNHLTPSQAQEMSRLSREGQRVLFRRIKEGKADPYTKLRAMADALLFKEQQASFISEPTDREREVKKKYDRIIDSLLNLVSQSFSAEDMSILKSVLDSSIMANIQKIDLIIGYLTKIRRSMIQADAINQELFAINS